jgi:hypothetical protein
VPGRPNAAPDAARPTPAQYLQLQKAAGNAACGQAFISTAQRPSSLLQRQFWEYTGDEVTPHGEQPKDVRSVDGEPNDDFEPIPGANVSGAPVYRRRSGFYGRYFHSPLDKLVPEDVQEQLTKPVAYVPGHRRMRSVHPSALPGGHGASAPASEKKYEYSKIFSIVQSSPLFKELQSRQIPVKFVQSESSGEGETHPERTPTGTINVIVCSIGSQAFDSAGADADEPARIRHALLCALHELHHAYHEMIGPVRGYEQEFAVRLGDVDRAKRLGMTGAPMERLATRPLLAYVDLLLARADKEYIATVTGESALHAPATVSAMLTYVPPEARHPGPKQDALIKTGEEWLAGGPDLSGSSSAVKDPTFALAIGCLATTMKPEELKARITSTLKHIGEKKLQVEVRKKLQSEVPKGSSELKSEEV